MTLVPRERRPAYTIAGVRGPEAEARGENTACGAAVRGVASTGLYGAWRGALAAFAKKPERGGEAAAQAAA